MSRTARVALLLGAVVVAAVAFVVAGGGKSTKTGHPSGHAYIYVVGGKPRSRGGEWQRAAVLGVAFAAAFILVQWNFAAFLLQPASDDWFFAVATADAAGNESLAQAPAAVGR